MEHQDNTKLALEVVTAGVRISEIHRILDAFVRTGAEPMPENNIVPMVAEDMTLQRLATILCNYPPSITKMKAKLKKMEKETPAYKVLETSIANLEAELKLARSYKNAP